MRSWLIRRLGGYTEQYDDYYDDYEPSYRTSFKLLKKFRRKKAVVSNVTDERVVDMSSAITLLDPDESVFMTMMTMMPYVRPNVHWLEDTLFPRLFGDPDDWGFGEWVDA